MRLLVTGASGFIGKNLLKALPVHWEVLATYHHSNNFVDYIDKEAMRNVTPLGVDLTDGAAGDRIVQFSHEFDGAIFLAANGDPALSVERPQYDLRTNALTVLEALRRVKVRRLVYVSSGAVYDGWRGAVSPRCALSPSLPYAISKLASEGYVRHLVRRGRVESAVNVRFFGAYGPHEPPRKIYTRLVQRFGSERDARFVIRGDGRNRIDAMFIDDAVRALLQLLERTDATGNILTVDLHAGQSMPIIDLVRHAGEAFGLNAEISFEGTVSEYNEFWSDDRTMFEQFGFLPLVSLGDGLHRLATHLGYTIEPLARTER